MTPGRTKERGQPENFRRQNGATITRRPEEKRSTVKSGEVGECPDESTKLSLLLYSGEEDTIRTKFLESSWKFASNKDFKVNVRISHTRSD